MFDNCQKSINQIFNTYKNLPQGYFGSILFSILALELFALLLTIILIYSSYWLGEVNQFDFTYYRSSDFYTYVADLFNYFPIINLLVFALFLPYLISMTKADKKDRITLTKYIAQISSKKWNLFIGFYLTLFLIIIVLYYLDYFSFGTNYFTKEEGAFQFKRWLYFVFKLLAPVLAILFAVVISIHDRFSITKIKNDWKFIIPTTILMLGLVILTTTFSEGIDHYIGQLLVIPFKSDRIAHTVVFLVQFAMFFFIIPAKIALLSANKKTSTDELLKIEEEKEIY